MTLRSQSFAGGAYLAIREGAGIVVRLVGVVVVTRLIGPVAYGLYVGALAVVLVLNAIAQLGTEVFLMRRDEEPGEEVYDQAFSILLVTATAVTVTAFLSSFLLADLFPDPRYLTPFRVLLLTLPVNVLWAPAQAKIERAFQYRRMAALEVGGDLVLYGTSIALALSGQFVMAPVLGYAAWQCFLLVGSCYLARYRPRWRWSTDFARALLRYGFTYSLSHWIGRLEELVNPLVVGRYLGAAGVGYVALTARVVDTLSFMTRVVYRLSLVALGRLQRDPGRVHRAVQEGMALQVLAVGPLLAGFALAAPWLMPVLFGPRWAPAVDLYPFIALYALMTAAFLLHVSVLFVRERNLAVARVWALRLAVLAVTATLLVPPLGLVGFGLAKVLAVVAYVAAHRAVRPLFVIRYRQVVPWLLAFAPPLFSPLVAWPQLLVFWVPAAAVVSTREARAQLVEYTAVLRRALVAPSRSARRGPQPGHDHDEGRGDFRAGADPELGREEGEGQKDNGGDNGNR